jgi:peptidoglycan/xylan/chitin deacetylase (PgdA/CDA1 family)
MNKALTKLIGALAALPVLCAAGPAPAADSAVVMMYHRFGESALPTTNIRLEQFDAHIEELRKPEYTVLPLPEIVAKLQAGQTLPDRAVGLSVDDAFLSVYNEAWPRLKQAGFPFTLFVATDPIDKRTPGYMSWDQIRELKKAGVTIGSQTSSHPHMPLETRERNAEELRASNERFRAELGEVPTLIAYPYGEYSLAVRDVTKAAGFVAGFGQHSGVLYPEADMFYLPRFAMNETFGSISRFRLAANALPLRVRDITPADPLLSAANNPPILGFTVTGDAAKRLSRLSCYPSSQATARIVALGPRIEVRLDGEFPPGRARINCTLMAPSGRWHWYGLQFYVPKGT